MQKYGIIKADKIALKNPSNEPSEEVNMRKNNTKKLRKLGKKLGESVSFAFLLMKKKAFKNNNLTSTTFGCDKLIRIETSKAFSLSHPKVQVKKTMP